MSMCKLTGESFDVQFCFLLISCKTCTCSNKDFGGPKIFTDNGYHLPFFETKKLEMKWNKIVKIEVNHNLSYIFDILKNGNMQREQIKIHTVDYIFI